MLKLGIGLTKAGTSLDIDALLFCERSGARDVGRISEFVRGIKKLGLWNSMVCWPLRSSQNYGSGDTVFSLGGLGTFNGTRVNGPTWGSDGMEFATDTATGRDKHITIPFTVFDIRANTTFSLVTNHGIGAAFSSGFQTGWGSNTGGSSTLNALVTRRDSATTNTIISPQSAGVAGFTNFQTTTLTFGTFREYVTQRKTNNSADATADGNRQYVNGLLAASGSNNGYAIANATTTLIVANNGSKTEAIIGKVAFACVINNWESDVVAFNALLKTTLLNGVLP